MRNMTKAVWNETTVAESDDVLLVEFAVYFPRDSVAPGVLRPCAAPTTYCHWKGVATYYDVVVNDEVNEGAAWTYEETYAEANALKGMVAFWKGVEVVDKPDGEPMMDPGGPVGSRTGHKALCWLLVRTDESELDAATIENLIGLDGTALASAFAHPHVKPFSSRYKWSLVDGALKKG